MDFELLANREWMNVGILVEEISPELVLIEEDGLTTEEVDIRAEDVDLQTA